jgi:hypothetical protein
MLLTLGSFLLPPLFVFGVYHLLTWSNTLGINGRVFWKRVAITSAICHVLLASGFLIFSYFDFRAILLSGPTNFGNYLFERSNFWRLMVIFDTVPMFMLIGMFYVLDLAGLNPPGLLAVTISLTYVAGTLQWFIVGGGIGALLERFFQGLKTPEPEEQEWE